MKVSERINIYFEKLEDWEIEALIDACKRELERRL